jgi:hypothetical protein
MADPLLLGPAALFLASTAYATAVAATKPDLPGEMFGLHLPGQVRTHLALGLGSAISAPWPMPVIATWAAVAVDPRVQLGGAYRGGRGVRRAGRCTSRACDVGAPPRPAVGSSHNPDPPRHWRRHGVGRHSPPQAEGRSSLGLIDVGTGGEVCLGCSAKSAGG